MSWFHISPEVQEALHHHRPVLALESTILAHGMPFPENLDFARRAEEETRRKGVVPATIAILNGSIRIGLTEDELEQLCSSSSVLKAGLRDLSSCVAGGKSAATTVSSTLAIAQQAGIEVFATGGIGGVHRGATDTFDISQDVWALARFPGIVVSAGAKAILDLEKTLEMMESLAIPVLGFRTNEFPAFYSRSSGLALTQRVESAQEIVSIFSAQKLLRQTGSLLIANPVPTDQEIPRDELVPIIEQALLEAEQHRISGKAVTPFLLQTIVAKTGGRALATNIALALNNVELGTAIATALTSQPV
ncbi:MAG: pseudouridine-5'-phosphate glycosidase [Candidatus Neomarinimicrobiota bacterium]|nr:MAG: pseudouridine-5'-phosphate glycosidase [Candidatus Neomarinimicrobiota bacterium]